MLRLAAGARIVRKLMRAEKEDGGIVFKAVLRPVAVMHVPIDDQHAGEPVFFLSIARGDGHIV